MIEVYLSHGLLNHWTLVFKSNTKWVTACYSENMAFDLLSMFPFDVSPADPADLTHKYNHYHLVKSTK